MIIAVARVPNNDKEQWLKRSMENRLSYFDVRNKRVVHVSLTETHRESNIELMVRIVSLMMVIFPILQLITYFVLLIESNCMDKQWLERSMENRLNYFNCGRRVIHVSPIKTHLESNIELMVRIVSIMMIIFPILQLTAYFVLWTESKYILVDPEKEHINGSLNLLPQINLIETELTLPQQIKMLETELKSLKEQFPLIQTFINSHSALKQVFLSEIENNKEFISKPNLEKIEGHPDDLLYQKRVLERAKLMEIHQLNEFFYFLNILPNLKESFFSHLHQANNWEQEEISQILPENLKSQFHNYV